MRTTQAFEDDLAVLCGAVQTDGTKLNKTQALQIAVARLADAYRLSWDYADMPDNQAPVMLNYRYRTESGQPNWVPTVPELKIIERPMP